MKLIDKDALVAEIEKETKTLKQEIPSCENKEHKKGKLFGLHRVLYLIDTLEVKEVDLDEEITHYFKGWGDNEIHCFAMMQDGTSVGIDECIDIAKYFFELGLKAQKGE